MAGASSQPLVSIITIVYNGEQYLEQTIRSVLDQTYRNIEYYIVDGGSTDQSVAIIRKYETFLAGWTSEPDKGISDAFNKGIANTTGSIVGLINADDWYEKDCVEKVVAYVSHHHIAYGDIRYWKNGDKLFVQEGNHELLKKEMTVNHPAVFVSRNCYEAQGAFDLKFRCAIVDLPATLTACSTGTSTIPFISAMQISGSTCVSCATQQDRPFLYSGENLPSAKKKCGL